MGIGTAIVSREYRFLWIRPFFTDIVKQLPVRGKSFWEFNYFSQIFRAEEFIGVFITRRLCRPETTCNSFVYSTENRHTITSSKPNPVWTKKETCLFGVQHLHFAHSFWPTSASVPCPLHIKNETSMLHGCVHLRADVTYEFLNLSWRYT